MQAIHTFIDLFKQHYVARRIAQKMVARIAKPLVDLETGLDHSDAVLVLQPRGQGFPVRGHASPTRPVAVVPVARMRLASRE